MHHMTVDIETEIEELSEELKRTHRAGEIRHRMFLMRKIRQLEAEMRLRQKDGAIRQREQATRRYKLASDDPISRLQTIDSACRESATALMSPDNGR